MPIFGVLSIYHVVLEIYIYKSLSSVVFTILDVNLLLEKTGFLHYVIYFDGICLFYAVQYFKKCFQSMWRSILNNKKLKT